MVETEKEKMRANLLRAVSHDLRTPLTGMIGASETLIKNKALLSEEEKDKLIGHVYEDSNWLLHMVENLLSVTRIREGESSVNKLPEPIEEVVSEAIMRVKKRYPKAQITVKVPDEFLMVPMDATLIEQVIMNLIENALIHSGSTLPIELIVSQNENDILFRVSDQGMGIKEDRLSTLFDGYSHMDNKSSDSTKGIGIGLSICKTIINAHGGTIWAENQEGGGAVFSFNLPM
jgi:two-component system sensor histidine kinase KdpD